MCQAAQEASNMGEVGQVLARVASSNAASWLNSINATLHQARTSNVIFVPAFNQRFHP